MPFIDTIRDLDFRLKVCDDQLDVFKNEMQQLQLGANEAKENLDKVKEYYRLSFSRAKDLSSACDITSSYELFVKNLAQVRNGSLTTEHALTSIEEATDSRELGIIFYNIGKVLELMFWMLATAVWFNATLIVGLPLILADPLLGIAITLGTSALMVASFVQINDCIDEFKSSDRLNEEDKRERDLVSFFKPAAAPVAVIATAEKDATDTDESSLLPV